jgi:hypothetical protein
MLWVYLAVNVPILQIINTCFPTGFCICLGETFCLYIISQLSCLKVKKNFLEF